MAEYPIKVSTAQGDFTLEKDEKGPVNKFMDINGVPVKVTHDEMLAMHHNPELEVKRGGEQAGEIGDLVLDSVVSEPADAAESPEQRSARQRAREAAKKIAAKGAVNAKEFGRELSQELVRDLASAIRSDDMKKVRRLLERAGINFEDPTLVLPPKSEKDEKNEQKEQKARTGPALIKTNSGELEGEVIGVSQKYPEGVNPKDSSLHYEVKVTLPGRKEPVVWKDVNALNVEFKEDSSEAQTRVVDNGELKEKQGRREFLETILGLQKKADEKYEQAQKENTILRLDKDDALKQKALGQIRESVVDDYMKGLSEDEQSDKKLRGQILEALNKEPGKLRQELAKLNIPNSSGYGEEIGEKIGSPGEMEIRGQLDDGTPIIFRKTGDNEWVYSRNGSIGNEWYPASPQFMRTTLGFDPTGTEGKEARPASSHMPPDARVYGGFGPRGRDRAGNDNNGGGESGGGASSIEVDTDRIDELNAADDKLKAKKKQLWEEYDNASPERQTEIIKEIRQIDEARDQIDTQRRKEIDGLSEDEVPEGEEQSPDDKAEEKKGRWYNRAKDKLNKMIATNPLMRGYTKVVTEKDPKQRRKYVLGFIAGTLVGALLAKYGLHHGGGGGGSTIHEHSGPVGGIVDHGPNPHHEVIFNEAHGNNTVRSILPDNWEQKPVPGHGYEQITDKYTHKVIEPHVTYGENGRYSVDTIRHIEANDHKVGTILTEFNDRDGGPGPTGPVVHKISVVE